MRAATEANLPPVIPQGNLVEVLGREVRQGLPGGLMVESSPSSQRRPPCKTNKGMSDEAANAAALTYLLTYLLLRLLPRPVRWWARVTCKVLCPECKPWHDFQVLCDFVYLVLYNLRMQGEEDTTVFGGVDNEFQTAYHCEEEDEEGDSVGSEPIEMHADDYSDSFIIGDKEQLE